MAFTGKNTGQINTLPMYGPPGQGQSQIGNYGSAPANPYFPMDQSLAMMNYLAARSGTRPKRRPPTLPLAFMYGFLDGGY